VFEACERPAVPTPSPAPAPLEATPRPLPEHLAFDLDTLLQIHQAMLGLATARADVVAIFSLPADFEKRRCIGWQEGLRRRLGLPARRTVGDDTGDLADLSYGAVYHPWLLVGESAAPGRLRAIPPDGAATGTIAARERARGVWIAPANLPLAGVLGLVPAIPPDDVAELFERQFNLAQRQPRDFRVISAHTLADDRQLLQLSVRRLMILLRKVAAELGMDMVFQSNDEKLRDRVETALTTMLGDMLARGALAGETAEDAFRVVTGEAVTTARDRDAGRFLALVQVAPSQPLEFLTVLLTRVGDGLVRATEA
jgi:phage tail sheath protein FI